jgi:hypothetical protein
VAAGETKSPRILTVHGLIDQHGAADSGVGGTGTGWVKLGSGSILTRSTAGFEPTRWLTGI